MLKHPFIMFKLQIPQVVKHFSERLKVWRQGENYTIFEGDIPIALVAHMDTVPMGRKGAFPPKIRFNQHTGIVTAPSTGLGADDRAGCLAIDELMDRGFRPWVILTDLEETGGHGARDLVREVPDPPESLKFMIQLDRRGQKDAVFYDMNVDDGKGKEFKEKIESYGFEETMGSFSDISIIAPAWKVAAVNLSIGYMNEHTLSERWDMNWWLKTVENVEKILDDHASLEMYGYTEKSYGGYNWRRAHTYAGNGKWVSYADSDEICFGCDTVCERWDDYNQIHMADCYGGSRIGCECPVAHDICMEMIAKTYMSYHKSGKTQKTLDVPTGPKRSEHYESRPRYTSSQERMIKEMLMSDSNSDDEEMMERIRSARRPTHALTDGEFACLEQELEQEYCI